ncbi:alpha/beta hydrolase [Diaminobutyricibacter sp. McL0618]|uniref:alpha/beta hydrolase n=1 Tax=Leifsonia sp. McL0618 TaxID=3415677 RepID=UPI003CFB4DED
MTLRIDQRPFLTTIDIVAVAFIVFLLVRKPTLRWIVTALIAIAAGAVFGIVLCWILVDQLDFFGVDLSTITRMWVALACAGLALVVVNLWHSPWWRKAIAIVAVPLIVVTGAAGINVDFGAYRNINDAVGVNPYQVVTVGRLGHAVHTSAIPTLASWTPPAKMASVGRISSVEIPPTMSNFPARPATIYLPPAALTANPPALPVLITMSGQPGQPSDMFTAGHLGTIMDAYAAAHKGIAPIVVEVDQLSNPEHNPMCVDGPLGNSATYIVTDVVHWIRVHFRVLTSPNSWAVNGFSQGGTCSVQFAAGHPEIFGTALAISSELYPTAGPDTIQKGFGGSAAKAAAARPTALFAAHAPYRNSLIVFAYGQYDARYTAFAQQLEHASQRAGVTTETLVSPRTAHDWNTVRYALKAGIPMILPHMGLAP